MAARYGYRNTPRVRQQVVGLPSHVLHVTYLGT